MKIIVLIIIVFFIFVSTSCEKEKFSESGFDSNYISEHKGKVFVEVPESYELSNIIIAIEDMQMDYSSFVRRNTEYYSSVKTYFSNYSELPLFNSLGLSNTTFGTHEYFMDHYELRTNSYRYKFGDDDLLYSKGLYKEWHNYDPFPDNKSEIEEFISVSNFRKFYSDNEDYYNRLISLYSNLIPIKQMWEWLETEFTTQIDCYKVILSPITDGSHNTETVAENEYKEVLMFVSVINNLSESISEVQRLHQERVVFTEIDHNYINPISSIYRDDIELAMPIISKWNSDWTENYKSAYATFNEYLTWSVFSIYIKENYNNNEFEEVNQAVIEQMENNRKFPLFGEFNEMLIALYEERDEGVILEELYSEILEWVKSISEES